MYRACDVKAVKFYLWPIEYNAHYSSLLIFRCRNGKQTSGTCVQQWMTLAKEERKNSRPRRKFKSNYLAKEQP